jgi:3-hydroxyisobutyrate dehydrogenase-like beta-hydroxyacid dehydrogenase
VSTVDAGTAQQVAEAIRGAGARYVEAPVSGSKQPAEKGQLIFLAGWYAPGHLTVGELQS